MKACVCCKREKKAMASKMRKFFEAKASGDDKKKNKEVGRLLNKKNKEGLDVIKLLLLGECLGDAR